MFEPLGNEWIAPYTEKAKQFSQGDPHRLVAAAFARLLSERDIQFDWLPDLTFQIDTRFHVEARPSFHPDHNLTDVRETDLQYAAIARIERGLIVVQGITHKNGWEKLAVRFPDGIPTQQLQSMSDWLGNFPHLHPFLRGEHEQHRLRADSDVQGGTGTGDARAELGRRPDHARLEGEQHQRGDRRLAA